MTLVTGCGASKGTVSGVVKLDGQPLDNGTILFFPAAGDGQTSHAFIEKDGHYRAEVSPTKMKVVISSSRVIGKRKKYEDVPDSPYVEERTEVLPARYSQREKTELTIDVVPGDNPQNFDLKSDPGKRGMSP
jgi:hypothetical protein